MYVCRLLSVSIRRGGKKGLFNLPQTLCAVESMNFGKLKIFV